MRILAIGDIHGYLIALDALLAAVAPTPQDWVVFLGDYVDRGPQSRGVLDRVIALEKSQRVIALRGNHEQMMMDSRDAPGLVPTWMFNGGEETLASYAPPGRQGRLSDVPAAHWDFLDHVCVDWFETERHLFVHGGMIPHLGPSEQPPQVMRWQKLQHQRPHFSGKPIVCGHTVQSDGVPLDLGFAVCIDTGIYLPEGWLTCLDVVTGDFWQANAAGALRKSNLSEIEETPEGNDE